MFWFWLLTGVATLAEIKSLLRERRRSELVAGSLWRLPEPPDFWSLVASVSAAAQAAEFATDAQPPQFDATGMRARDFFSRQIEELARERRRQPWIWSACLLQTALFCAATAVAVVVAVQGRLLGEYALVLLWGLEMAKGAHRAALGKAIHPAWFKRHAWVHVWWMPLVAWIRLAAFLAAPFRLPSPPGR